MKKWMFLLVSLFTMQMAMADKFDKKGNWKEVSCRRMTVPQAVVPVKIQEFVKSNYPEAKVLKIEKDRYEYEVKLSNFWELTFDLNFNLIDMDNDND